MTVVADGEVCEFCQRSEVRADELADHLIAAHGAPPERVAEFVGFLLDGIEKSDRSA